MRENITMRYAAYMPSNPEKLPIVQTYEFKDDGRRAKDYVSPTTGEVFFIGLFKTAIEANIQAVQAWQECHSVHVSMQRHPASQ